MGGQLGQQGEFQANTATQQDCRTLGVVVTGFCFQALGKWNQEEQEPNWRHKKAVSNNKNRLCYKIKKVNTFLNVCLILERPSLMISKKILFYYVFRGHAHM